MADLYFQASQLESWVLEDSIIKNGSFNIERGVGVRAISGDKTGFAYSDDIILPALESSARMAVNIARVGQHGQVHAWKKNSCLKPLYEPLNPISSWTEQEKISLRFAYLTR